MRLGRPEESSFNSKRGRSNSRMPSLELGEVRGWRVMRSRRLLLLDLAFDPDFALFGRFVEQAVESINVDLAEKSCHVDYVRSRDRDVSTTAFTSECDVLHVIAHAGSEDEPAFYAADDSVSLSLSEFPVYAKSLGRRGVAASTIIADGCNTATGVWQRSIRDCLRGPVTYIGTSSQIG